MLITFNTAQFALTDGTNAQFTVSFTTKPQIMRLVLLCTTADAGSTLNPGDELDCFSAWNAGFACCPFSCGYNAAANKVLLNYDGALGSGTSVVQLTFTSFSNFSLKVYYY